MKGEGEMASMKRVTLVGGASRFSWRTGMTLIMLVVLAGAGQASADVDKGASYAEMTDLGRQLAALKPQLDGNPASALAYETALNRYLELSLALGGDDPAQIAHPVVQSEVRPSTAGTFGGLPAGCNTTTTNFANATPVAIPTGPAVVSSTLVVSGAAPYLLDLNMTTQIPHTFAADLDITLTSPAGTVVTITTDNGAGNDDVFNGTLWDDSANPAGQVPYTTNNGLVTDQAYVNLTAATPLVPEEAMGAFIGEDPNGTWTLTVSDDLAGDGGSINAWSLDVTTLPNAPIVATVPTQTQATPVAIPTGPAVVTSTLVVAGAGSAILDVNATTFITHTFAADLDITLTSPAGTVVTLTTDNGAGNDNVFNGTLWDDGANPGGQVPYTTNNGLVTDQTYVNLTTATPLVPEEAMAAFIGEDPNGTWTLTISDDLSGDGGSIDSWSLDIDTFTCASADLSITKTDGITNIAAGQATTYTITASNAGPTDAPGSQVADTFPAPLTTCNWTCAGAAGGTCTAGGAGNIADSVNLPTGASVTYTATCTVPASTAAGTNIANTATVTAPMGVPDPIPGNNTATDTDTTIVSADLAITKTDGVATVVAGDALTYSIVASNAGPSDAVGSTVTDTFPAALTCTWTCAGGGGTCTGAGSGNINDVVNLPVGTSVTYTATCTVAPGTVNGTVISNTADVAVAGGASDPAPGNNAATDTTTVIAGSGVTGTKTVAGSTIPGGAIVYTIILNNAGPGPQADNPGDEFIDVLPSQVTFDSAGASSGTVANAGNTVSWNGAIAAGGSVTITINATINAGAFGLINNQGTINYDSNGDGSNDASALTDNPAAPGPTDPTGFLIAQTIPTLGPVGLLLLAIGLIAIWYRRERLTRR
jgi:uncharacterized repeat protein (TIGR01451 family)